MNKYIPILFASSLLTGCMGGSNIKDINAFDRRPLVKASIMPTKAQIKGAKTRVIVLEVDVSSADIAKKAKLGKVIRNKTESLLSDAGVKVVDRKLAKKLQKEIQLAEIKGDHGYKGPEIADFSVTGQVVFSNFSTRYSAASRWVDKKGKAHYVPAKCHYKAEIEATLKIHALPSLDLVDTITITDSENRTQDLNGNNYRRYISNQSCPKYNDTQISGLLSEAGADAVVESKVQLKNNFSPRGYITEYRVKEDKSIFKISMGKLAGVKEGQEINILQTFKDNNELTGESNIEQRMLSGGAVSNIVGEKYAWIVIDDAAKARQVRLGDTVKILFEDSMFDNIKKMF